MLLLLARRLWPCFILAAALPSAAAQKSLVIPLLPAPGWQLVSTTKLPLQNLRAFGDDLAVNQEVGVNSAGQRIYRRRNFRVTVIFEKAADASSAYSLYTLYRSASMTPVKGIDLAVSNDAVALMTRGRYFIRAVLPANPPLPQNDLRSLLAEVGGARLSIENTESLPSPLPLGGLEPATEKYMLGPQAVRFAFPSFPANLIGFADGVEAKAGTYRGGEPMVLFEVSYPTPELARLQFQRMDGVLHLSGQGAALSSAYGRLDGSFILLALHAKSRDAAFHFLDRFVIKHVVSSVPAYHHKENFVGEIVQLLVANGELIGLVIIFSILGGIVMYAAKRFIMKVFPRSEWGRSDEDTLIRLNLR